MAALVSCQRPPSLHSSQRFNGVRQKVAYSLLYCRLTSPDPKSKGTSQTPKLLMMAVSGVTELLRLFSPSSQDRTVLVNSDDENSASSANEVLGIIRSDYGKAYFVTGLFTSRIYADDCSFEDPTIKFKGKELYARNLSLLVPFFVNPSIQLKELAKGLDSEEVIIASWKLRTYLKLPWKPLISVDGSTAYYLDDEFRIVRHVETWNVSALEAIIQIFTPSFGSSDQ